MVDEDVDTDGDLQPDCIDSDDDGDGSPDLDDCAPLDPTIHPGAPEVLDDAIDQDCDGADAVTCYGDFVVDETDTAGDFLLVGDCGLVTGSLAIVLTTTLTNVAGLSNLASVLEVLSMVSNGEP